MQGRGFAVLYGCMLMDGRGDEVDGMYIVNTDLNI